MKQKTHASADFLGVMAIPRKVVGTCCISTTLFAFQRATGPRVVTDVQDRPKRADTNQRTAQGKLMRHANDARALMQSVDAKRPQRRRRGLPDCRSSFEERSGS